MKLRPKDKNYLPKDYINGKWEDDMREWADEAEERIKELEDRFIGNHKGSLDEFLLNSPVYTQEEREVVMQAIGDYLETLNKD